MSAEVSARQVQVIMDLIHCITSGCEIEELSQKILWGASRLVDSQYCCLYKYLPAEKDLLPLAELRATQFAVPQSLERPPATKERPRSSLATIALARREPVVSLREYEDSSSETEWIALPLISQGKALGVLELQPSIPVNEGEMQILKGIAEIAAVALQQIQLNQTGVTLLPFHLKDQDGQTNLLSLISHELRSPLNTLNGFLDLTLEEIVGDLNPQQHEFIQRARASSENLYAMLEDLFLISRVDSKQLRLSREVCEVREIIENAVEDVELSARDRQIAVQLQLSTAPSRVYTDPVRLQQLVRNLLVNAINFTLPGGKVEISAREVSVRDLPRPAKGEIGEHWLQLEVRDTGIGIEQEYQQKIFERFFQIATVHGGRSGGLGLGLSVVQLIVEKSDGFVEIKSIPGQGSVFTCWLPGILL